MTDKNNKLILEIIDIFIPQMEETVTDMQEAQQRMDFDMLGNLAHKAKSAVAIMGMNKTSALLKELESCCREHRNADTYPAVIESLKSAFLMAKDELEVFKKTNNIC